MLFGLPYQNFEAQVNSVFRLCFILTLLVVDRVFRLDENLVMDQSGARRVFLEVAVVHFSPALRWNRLFSPGGPGSSSVLY